MAEQVAHVKIHVVLTSIRGKCDKTFRVLDDAEAHSVCYYEWYAHQISVLVMTIRESRVGRTSIVTNGHDAPKGALSGVVPSNSEFKMMIVSRTNWILTLNT